MTHFHKYYPFIALLLLFFSCTTYQRYQLPKNRIANIDRDNFSYYLVDAAHPLTRVWYMSECTVNDREVACFVTKMTEMEANDVSFIRNKQDARWSKNDVLFFADPRYAAALPDTSTVTIQLDQLEKVEVYELNHIKTFGTPLLSITGLLFILYLISGG